MDVKDPSSSGACKTPYTLTLDSGEVLGHQTSKNGQVYMLSVNVNLPLLLIGTEQWARWITALIP